LELLSLYLESIGKLWPVFYEKFAKIYIPELKTAVSECLLNAPENSLRNIRKEIIESIIKNVELLLKRVLSTDERTLECD
jgi:hypothetical protein